MNKINKKLATLSEGKISNWSRDAAWRRQNRKWLRYSGNIARRVLAAIEDKEGMNQKKLAEQIGVSPQYMSKLLKGEQNLSLETIAKLSEAVGVELISFPEYKYSKPVQSPIFIPTITKPALKVAYCAKGHLLPYHYASDAPKPELACIA